MLCLSYAVSKLGRRRTDSCPVDSSIVYVVVDVDQRDLLVALKYRHEFDWLRCHDLGVQGVVVFSEQIAGGVNRLPFKSQSRMFFNINYITTKQKQSNARAPRARTRQCGSR